MKKKLLSLLLAATMVVSAAACGGGSDTPSGSKANPTPTKAATATQAVQATATPTPVPVEEMKFSQAPNIKAAAKVEDRLPVKEDVFVEQVDANGSPLAIGNYGGQINLLQASGSWDLSRPMLESIIHYNTDGTYYANVIKEFSYSSDYKVWTFKLREGMRWSDGEPFTADDIVFWYEVCHKTNFDGKRDGWNAPLEEVNGVVQKGQFAVLTKVNDYEVTWTFQNPKYPASFIENGDFKWCWAPKHYLIDLVPSYYLTGETLDEDATAKANEQALINAQKKGLSYSSVKDLGKALTYNWWNVSGLPTLNAWVLSTEPGKNSNKGDYCECVRNEYFWKVDAKGQQLPYCDLLTFTKVAESEQQLLLIRSGKLDLCDIAMKDISSTLSDMGEKGKLITYSSVNWGSPQITFNYTTTDSKFAELFAKKEFRQAMSISVDRNEVSGLLNDGFLAGGQCAPQEGNFGYDEEWINKWTEYDVAAAKKLLESCGLKMGADGFYDFADGTDLVLTFYFYSEKNQNDEYEILKQYWNKAGIKTDSKGFTTEAFDQEIDNNTWLACIGPHTSIGGLGLRSRVAPFVPVAQAAEWYGDYGTYYQTKGEKGVKPVGEFQKLIDLYEEWNSTPDKETRDKLELQIYDIHKENLFSIAYLRSAGEYKIINSELKNYPTQLIWDDLYQNNNIAHFWVCFK